MSRFHAICAIVGTLTVAAGLWLIYPPAALLWLGIALLADGVLDVGGRRR